MSRRAKPPVSDAWYDNELPTRRGLVTELQRIAARTRARPLRVIILAIVMTAAIGYKVWSKQPIVEAEVVLLLTEGSLAQKDAVAPVTVEQLRDYVATVLLPDDKLLAVVKHRDLYKLRATLGDEFATTSFREQIGIEVWKNSFVYYDEDLENPEHSARIGITVSDTDPDRAILLAHDLGEIVLASAADHQRAVANALAKDVKALRDGLAARLDELASEHAKHVTEMLQAERDHLPRTAAAAGVLITEVEHEQLKLEAEQDNVLKSRDAVADQIAAAGLDMTVQMVEEHHPERNDHRGFVLAMVLVVVALGSLLGASLVFGAFDSRLHDLDDLARLGIPVLGHVPGFPGDHVGSLETRGALRRRVPSFLRWRSQR